MLSKINVGILNVVRIIAVSPAVLKRTIMSTKKKDTKDDIMKMLKSVCKKCTKETITTYYRSIKRLFRLIEEDSPLPVTGGWLAKKNLKDKLTKLDLKKRRHLSIAGVKAAKMYKVNSDWFEKQMYKDANAYSQKRGENKKSDKEKASWPDNGLKSLKKAAKLMWNRVKILLKQAPSLKTLYKYQLFILLKLYTTLPLRNTFADIRLTKSENNNYLKTGKGNFEIVLQNHKTSKKVGTKTVKLNRASTMATRKFLKYRADLVTHDFLLSNVKGERLSKTALGKSIHRITKELLGKAFGSRIIRVLFATDNAKTIKEAQEISDKLLHSSLKTTQGYVRK